MIFPKGRSLSAFIAPQQVAGVKKIQITLGFCSLECDRCPPQMSHLLKLKGHSFLYIVIFKARIIFGTALRTYS